MWYPSGVGARAGAAATGDPEAAIAADGATGTEAAIGTAAEAVADAADGTGIDVADPDETGRPRGRRLPIISTGNRRQSDMNLPCDSTG